MEKISACLVVRNEEKIIERCLKSISGVVDEIIVVHDGECGDRTLEIAKKYTSNIFIRNYIGMCDSHRPFSFEKASGQWILMIDADEFLSDSLRENISRLVDMEDIDGYEFSWPIWNGEEYVTKNNPKKLVLARKEKIYFWGVPHGVIQVKGKVKKSNLLFEHRPNGNKWSWKNFFRKTLPWTKIHASYILKDQKEIPEFQTNKENYPSGIIVRKKYPWLFPAFVIYTLLRNMKASEIFSLNMWKGRILLAVYELILDLNIIKLKLGIEKNENLR